MPGPQYICIYLPLHSHNNSKKCQQSEPGPVSVTSTWVQNATRQENVNYCQRETMCRCILGAPPFTNSCIGHWLYAAGVTFFKKTDKQSFLWLRGTARLHGPETTRPRVHIITWCDVTPLSHWPISGLVTVHRFCCWLSQQGFLELLTERYVPPQWESNLGRRLFYSPSWLHICTVHGSAPGEWTTSETVQLTS